MATALGPIPRPIKFRINRYTAEAWPRMGGGHHLLDGRGRDAERRSRENTCGRQPPHGPSTGGGEKQKEMERYPEQRYTHAHYHVGLQCAASPHSIGNAPGTHDSERSKDGDHRTVYQARGRDVPMIDAPD